MLSGPPSATRPDISCDIICCMLGSDNNDVAMFISIGLDIIFARSNPPTGRPAATVKLKVTVNAEKNIPNSSRFYKGGLLSKHH